MEWANVINQFAIEGEVLSAELFGNGHIHQTFKVSTSDKPYLLQEINEEVFADVPSLMQNIQAVSEHLKGTKGNALELVLTKQGQPYYEGQAGLWRVFHFVGNSKSYDQPTDGSLAELAGEGFGEFISQLADLPLAAVSETIPDFHDICWRFRQWDETKGNASSQKLEECVDEIGFVESQRKKMEAYFKGLHENTLPLRVIHNDTKLNNILFVGEQQMPCVVDLDTVMPGYVAFDFGDAIRTIANRAEEDEKDLAKVQFEKVFFERFAKGFAAKTISVFTKKEVESLAFAPAYMTFIMGLRFLTDYLGGNKYYSIKHEKHNLVRAKCQFAFAQVLHQNISYITNYIQSMYQGNT
ncbi:aminoglycoside phosphotransferase family protein [Flammeovirgaceae bacterium SG7u.111]|nr:aminoglycoside phosphotransferase family protein [Flammeovirgaceae bacterium SG7u.132]WPO33018.1 aminoglycoside phosphotransferase family protein [Flammeovirgaceae bacterium SG7u.111]